MTCELKLKIEIELNCGLACKKGSEKCMFKDYQFLQSA